MITRQLRPRSNSLEDADNKWNMKADLCNHLTITKGTTALVNSWQGSGFQLPFPMDQPSMALAISYHGWHVGRYTPEGLNSAHVLPAPKYDPRSISTEPCLSLIPIQPAPLHNPRSLCPGGRAVLETRPCLYLKSWVMSKDAECAPGESRRMWFSDLALDHRLCCALWSHILLFVLAGGLWSSGHWRMHSGDQLILEFIFS